MTRVRPKAKAPKTFRSPAPPGVPANLRNQTPSVQLDDESSASWRFSFALSSQIVPSFRRSRFPALTCQTSRAWRLQRKRRFRPSRPASLRRPPLSADLRDCKSASPARTRIPAVSACHRRTLRHISSLLPQPVLGSPGAPQSITARITLPGVPGALRATVECCSPLESRRQAHRSRFPSSLRLQVAE